MALGYGRISLYDIQREFGGNNPIYLSEYWRNPSDGVGIDSYVTSKSAYGNHPNTVNIPTYPNRISLGNFHGSYSLLGLNRYYTGVYGFSLHFYTSNPGGEFLGAPNFYNLQHENYFYVHSGPVFPNTTALYRFFQGNLAGGAGGPHLYTTNYSEGANAPGFNYEGIVGYVYTYQAPNTQPFYRGTSNEGDFLYTYDSNEINNAGYQNNGVAFYVFASTNWWN